MQGALAPEWQAPFQASATPQVAAQRLARREPPGCTRAALQHLPRDGPLPARCALSWHIRGALVVSKFMGHGTSGPRGKVGNTQPSHKRRGQGARAQDWPSPIQASVRCLNPALPANQASHTFPTRPPGRFARQTAGIRGAVGSGGSVRYRPTATSGNTCWPG